jgi:hypothetical protein
MVLAGRTLFVAGPPDLGNTGEEALAAVHGRKGGLLWAVSTADGSRLAEYKLDAPPVFDSLAAAGGRLYLATTDARVICFAPR